MTVRGAVFCPHPPLLVPEIAQGAAPELDGLRAASRIAIRRVMAPDVRPVVIGTGPQPAVHQPNARGSLAGYGVSLEVPLGFDEPGPVELPLSLTIGAWLLRDVLGPNNGATGVSVDSHGTDLPGPEGEDIALLVMGDGSARRSTSAPGYLDERAAAFDARVAAALAGGDPLALRVDPRQAGELLVAGGAAWRAAAALLEPAGPFKAELLYDDAPYGVGYFVAAWTSGA